MSETFVVTPDRGEGNEFANFFAEYYYCQGSLENLKQLVQGFCRAVPVPGSEFPQVAELQPPEGVLPSTTLHDIAAELRPIFSEHQNLLDTLGKQTTELTALHDENAQLRARIAALEADGARGGLPLGGGPTGIPCASHSGARRAGQSNALTRRGPGGACDVVGDKEVRNQQPCMTAAITLSIHTVCQAHGITLQGSLPPAFWLPCREHRPKEADDLGFSHYVYLATQKIYGPMARAIKRSVIDGQPFMEAAFDEDADMSCENPAFLGPASRAEKIVCGLTRTDEKASKLLVVAAASWDSKKDLEPVKRVQKLLKLEKAATDEAILLRYWDFDVPVEPLTEEQRDAFRVETRLCWRDKCKRVVFVLGEDGWRAELLE